MVDFSLSDRARHCYTGVVSGN